MSIKSRLKSYFITYESGNTKEIFEKNEYEANRLTAVIIIACMAILIISWVLNLCGVFNISKVTMNLLFVQGMIEFAVPLVLYKLFNGKKRWLKYVMVLSLLLVCMRLYSVLNHNVILIMVFPILLSSRYFSRGFTVNVSVMTIIALAIATASTIFFGVVDLNFYPQPADGAVIVIKENLRSTLVGLVDNPWAAVGRIMLHGFIPRMFGFLIISMIAVLIADRGHDMVLNQDKIARASAGVKAELNTATLIQNGMVPTIFPPFPDRKDFDIYAAMYTAKEVGGDFYDFFLVDDDHLAMVIADVSGKGIPAALFMMASKILIADKTLTGGTPAEILEFVNKRICSNNQAEMFVTVWLGILDLKTGKVIAANAGHEYPALRKRGGEFEILKDKHGFVVGGMDFVKYRNYEFTLNKGDSVFVYTDGIPEANNKNEELFGPERMVDALNINPDGTSKELISNVKKEVDKFVGDAVQFDDLTMLCVKYYGPQEG